MNILEWNGTIQLNDDLATLSSKEVKEPNFQCWARHCLGASHASGGQDVYISFSALSQINL